MHLYTILFKKHPKKIFYFALLGVIAGLINALLFMYINQLIGKVLSNENLDFKWSIFSFLFTLWLFLFSKRFLAISIIHFTQNNLYDFKSELVHLVLKSEYEDVSKRRDLIFNVLTRDIEHISEAANVITNLISSVIMVLGCLGYIAFISWKLFLISFLVIFFGIFSYRLTMKGMTSVFEKVKTLNDHFVLHLNQIITGFKEIKVSKEKGIDLENNYIKANLKGFHSLIVEAYSGFMNSQNIGMLLFYLAIGFILITGVPLMHIDKESLVTFVFILLFINGPIQSIILQIPVITEANVSSGRLSVLKTELLQNYHPSNETLSINEKKSFQSIKISEIQFRHKNDDRQFEIGPVSINIHNKEIIFIHGGNGSGKTSFIMCLLGIYKCDKGEILLDGKPIDENYSSLFATVFSDFFLFDKFYGSNSFNAEKAQYYLNLFEMEEKVSISPVGFSTTKLSMGQRKRLALIHALLDDKPIIVLDEWAADQDPYFREKFYNKILPIIKEEGKTIIAITHDDKYFSAADHLLKMEYGKLTKIN